MKINIFFHTLLTFWPDFFFFFHVDFWHSKNVDLYSFGEGRLLYTHENVDIYGWPLTHLALFLIVSFSFPQIMPKITQTRTLYTRLSFYSHAISPYLIILDKNKSVQRSHPI